MQRMENKTKLLGEIAIVLGLQLIMLIFRLVQPIQWPNIFPGEYITYLNEFIYLGIELGLIVVIVAHLIFGISFKELGLYKIKENIGSFIINIVFLGVGVGVAYFMSLFSKNVELHWGQLICQILTNFIAIAFIKEIIFRGFLFKKLYDLTNRKGILASLVTAIFFAGTYLPAILMNLNEISFSILLKNLTVPFFMGLFLSLIYYYTQNLWIGIIFHGVWISLLGLEQDFALCAIEIIYVVSLVIYLIAKMIQYYRGSEALDEEDETEFVEEAEQISQDTIIVNLDETLHVSKQMVSELEVQSPEEQKGDEVPVIEKTMSIPTPLESLENTMIMPALSQDAVHKQKPIEELEENTPDLMSVLNVDIEDEEEYQEEPDYITYLENYLGEFEAIYKQEIPTQPPIDILYFKGEKANALVTNGMRNMPMSVPTELEDYQNIELMMYVDKQFDLSKEGLEKGENGWLIKWLMDMAFYPSLKNGYLGWGHIVEPLEVYDESIKYNGAMVYPSINEIGVNVGRYRERGKSAFLYTVIPLYKEEIKFVQEQSSQQFMNLMASRGINQIITPKRINVVSYMKQQ